MALVSHLSPHVANKLHEAGLLSESAKEQIQRRNKLVKRLWVLVAVIFGLTVLGVSTLMNASPSANPVSAQQASR